MQALGKDKEELISLRDAKKKNFKNRVKISTFDAFSEKFCVFCFKLGLSSDFTMSEERLDVRDFLKLLKKMN